jgi:hypothetical protein
MLVPGSVHAAAPIYFDLWGLILWTLLYFFGLFTLIGFAATTKGTLARWLLVGWVAAPIIFIGVFIGAAKHAEAAKQRELDAARQQRFEEEGRKVRDCVEGVVKAPSCGQYLEWKPPEGMDGSSLSFPEGRGR